MALHHEPHPDWSGNKSKWLRAAVLGANDGIISTASVIVGVAGASNASAPILTAGIAALTAGALSMAVGEYVSVSSQRDTEKALLEKERLEILHSPEAEMEELIGLYQLKGMTRETAEKVAHELDGHNTLLAHAEAELHIDPNHLSNPWQAALASAGAFLSGAIIPLIAVAVPPAHLRVPVTFGAVLVALIITGTASARIGGSSKRLATLRIVMGGIIAMAVTFGIGHLFGVVGL